jgi:uncharacterized membrane protein
MKLHISNLILLYFGLALLGVIGFFFTLFLPEPVGFYAFIIAAALGGLGVSTNIYYTKKNKRQLVCPTGSDCNAVVNSRYSKFFGISLEYWGMTYFSVIVISYLALITTPDTLGSSTRLAILLFTMAAGLFSSYLLFVQAFILRQWCIWCILAAFLSLTVFTISLISSQTAIAFLVEIERGIEMLRFLGFSLGLGGASAAIFSFFRFLKKDLSIDDHELEVIKGIFELVWVGFGLTIISQFALYVIYAQSLATSGPFLAQVIALFAAALAGGVLMIIYAPFLVFVPFQKLAPGEHHSFLSLRRPTLIFGAIALSSWYFAFVMNFIPAFNFTTLLLIYLSFLAIVIAGCLEWERGLDNKKDHSGQDTTTPTSQA